MNIKRYNLCTTRDDFVKDKCIWIAQLKDGTKVFQDDGRSGVEIESAWIRLGNYVRDHPRNGIAQMRLRLHTHIIHLPSDKPFYFYSKGLVQAMSAKEGLGFHIVGWPDNSGGIWCAWYKVPELIIAQEKSRPIQSCRPEQLIGNVPSAA